MTGGWLRSSGALAMSAAATRPVRCACLPSSSGNASKMPKVEGPSRIANHAVVDGSSCTIDKPPRRKFSTSFSLPGLASNLTNKATLTIFYLLLFYDVQLSNLLCRGPLEFHASERKDERKCWRVLPWVQTIKEHKHFARIRFIILN